MSERFVIRPGPPLEGEIRVSGATKNSGLKQLAAAILAPGTSTFTNMPPVVDCDVMIEVMEAIGARVEWTGADTLQVDTGGTLTPEAPYELVSRMRASINVLGPLLGRCGEARVALPGGDAIGSRRLDMHLRGLEAMGVEAKVVHGFIEARAHALKGARIVLEFPSVGATENLLTAAVRAKGTTVIENAAREPEITALTAYLTRMGAQIIGAGTSTITVEGVGELIPVDAELMADRIEAGTLLMACGVAGGEINLVGPRLEHLEMLAMKLGAMGMKVSPTADGIWAFSRGRLKAIDIATLPYPGFATDFMPQAVALLCVAQGSGIVTENLFDGRFGFVAELARMGADVRTEGRHAVVRGVERLSGAPVRALDVRAGAALILAGLAADGETQVHDTHHVDRGYRDLPGTLAALGADVRRMTDQT
ncbi:MAG: UDP-N-acetylglucosamine 1-carboxyvinyltransferase [Actinomycetota bacterium]|nr:UDP-N-acetylglucosamine 1-carboxyvinyltransferase [Actinomycetota bacterium]